MLKADEYMKSSINEILYSGCTMQNPVSAYADGTLASTLFVNGVVHKYDISKDEFPITTLRPIMIDKAIGEILWIYQDQSNDLDLLNDKYGISWWDSWEIKGTRSIGQVYGATVRDHDLMNILLDDIINYPYERRHIINLWQVDDFKKPHGLKPCCYQTQFIVRDEYLDMILYQRSSDWLTAGNINQMQYVAFQMMVCKHCGYLPGMFIHMMANQHIYDRHFNQAKEMLKRESTNCYPKLKLNTDKTNFYDFTVNDFVLEDYIPVKPQLKFEIAVHDDQNSKNFLT